MNKWEFRYINDTNGVWNCLLFIYFSIYLSKIFSFLIKSFNEKLNVYKWFIFQVFSGLNIWNSHHLIGLLATNQLNPDFTLRDYIHTVWWRGLSPSDYPVFARLPEYKFYRLRFFQTRLLFRSCSKQSDGEKIVLMTS
jgi:hypothetical protein